MHMNAVDRRRLDAEMKQLRDRASESDRAIEQAKDDLNHKRSRLRALEELHARLEGVGQGVKALLKTKDPALLGLVVDHIEAPAALTAAFAGLLGAELQSVIVSDLDRGVALLADLARTKGGRAALVAAQPPLVAGSVQSGHPAPEGDGVIGPLIDRLLFAPEDQALARTLVGGAVVVETAADALRLARCRARVPLVALDGTVVRPGGRMSGGSGDGVATALIERKREMRELHESVARKSEEVTALLEAQQVLRLRMTELGSALDTHPPDGEAPTLSGGG
jgi:chromosome segregation protein